MNKEPWPSTYEQLGDRTPTQLVSNYHGRIVGAFRSAIPAYTIEPPQIHLNTERDGEPFEELITDFDIPFRVDFFDFQRLESRRKIYEPGQNIVIPPYVIHWLVNPNDRRLEFTCEYAPHPWDGNGDEPEFRNFGEVMAFVEERGLQQKLRDVIF